MRHLLEAGAIRHRPAWRPRIRRGLSIRVRRAPRKLVATSIRGSGAATAISGVSAAPAFEAAVIGIVEGDLGFLVRIGKRHFPCPIATLLLGPVAAQEGSEYCGDGKALQVPRQRCRSTWLLESWVESRLVHRVSRRLILICDIGLGRSGGPLWRTYFNCVRTSFANALRLLNSPRRRSANLAARLQKGGRECKSSASNGFGLAGNGAAFMAQHVR